MVASYNALSSDWFIDCRCITHFSSHQTMFISYTESPVIMKNVRKFNRVIIIASGYECVWSVFQLLDGRTDAILLEEMLHLLGSLISSDSRR